MSHRATTHVTHFLTAKRRQEASTDELGEPVYDHVEVLTDEPVRYQPAGTSFERGDSGERVARNPTATGQRALVDELQEGDDVTLTPIDADVDEVAGASFEVVSVEGRYGRRAGPGLAVAELRAVD